VQVQVLFPAPTLTTCSLRRDVAALLHSPVESRRIIIDITAWYRHFMTGLWLYIISLLSFAAQ
jgi:hypothetical protein